MNYRHAFHAGNICDAVKHIVLTILVRRLAEKEKGFCVLDTHAGTGLYDLEDPRAAKTGEAQAGVLKLLAVPPLPGCEAYYEVIRALNPGGQIRFYPGSPLFVRKLLRPQDRLVACELHPEEANELRRHFRNDAQAQIHCRDGYEALGAFLPPPEKRGLVLIDPPFEETNEFERLAAAVKEAHARWPQGVYMIWYPVKERPAIWRFQEALVAAKIPKTLCAEFVYDEEMRADRLNGCGLILINSPWQMEEKLKELFPALHAALGNAYRGGGVKWLVS